MLPPKANHARSSCVSRLDAVAPAAVARGGVAVVAGLVEIQDPVAAALDPAGGAAAVAARGVAIVALLALCEV